MVQEVIIITKEQIAEFLKGQLEREPTYEEVDDFLQYVDSTKKNIIEEIILELSRKSEIYWRRNGIKPLQPFFSEWCRKG